MNLGVRGGSLNFGWPENTPKKKKKAKKFSYKTFGNRFLVCSIAKLVIY